MASGATHFLDFGESMSSPFDFYATTSMFFILKTINKKKFSKTKCKYNITVRLYMLNYFNHEIKLTFYLTIIMPKNF